MVERAVEQRDLSKNVWIISDKHIKTMRCHIVVYYMHDVMPWRKEKSGESESCKFPGIVPEESGIRN